MGRLRKIYRYLLHLFQRQSKNEGWTLFAPLKIVPEYKVDLEKGQVTGLVKYDQKVYLTVVVDAQKGKTDVAGSLRSIHKHTKPFKKKNYIKMIEEEANALLENNLPNQ